MNFGWTIQTRGAIPLIPTFKSSIPPFGQPRQRPDPDMRAADNPRSGICSALPVDMTLPGATGGDTHSFHPKLAYFIAPILPDACPSRRDDLRPRDAEAERRAAADASDNVVLTRCHLDDVPAIPA